MSFTVGNVVSTITGNGNSSEFVYKGGDTTFHIFGTFASGTVKIEASLADSANFTTLKDSSGADLSFDTDSIFKIDIGKCRMRFVTSGVSGTAAINIKAS